MTYDEYLNFPKVFQFLSFYQVSFLTTVSWPFVNLNLNLRERNKTLLTPDHFAPLCDQSKLTHINLVKYIYFLYNNNTVCLVEYHEYITKLLEN